MPCIPPIHFIDTFASQRLVFKRKNEPFLICYKCDTKTHVSNLMHFEREMGNFLPKKRDAEK